MGKLILGSLCLAILLVACGGNDGDDPTPVTPSPVQETLEVTREVVVEVTREVVIEVTREATTEAPLPATPTPEPTWTATPQVQGGGIAKSVLFDDDVYGLTEITFVNWTYSPVATNGRYADGNVYTFTSLDQRKFVVVTYILKNPGTVAQARPIILGDDATLATTNQHFYEIWRPPLGIHSDEYAPRLSSADELAQMPQSYSSRNLLPGESTDVDSLAFEIPFNEVPSYLILADGELVGLNGSLTGELTQPNALPAVTLTPRSSSPPVTDPRIPYPGNGGGPTLCRDGSISGSSGRGTCSHHGGIAR